MFFEFMRVKNSLEMILREQDSMGCLLTLFENVASMSEEDMATISRHFNMKPLILNASVISPARRNRAYWLNW